MSQILVELNSNGFLCNSSVHALLKYEEFAKWPFLSDTDFQNRSKQFEEHLSLAECLDFQIVSLRKYLGGRVLILNGDSQADAFWGSIRKGVNGGSSRCVIKLLTVSDKRMESRLQIVPENLVYCGSIGVADWCGEMIILTQPFECSLCEPFGERSGVGECCYADCYVYFQENCDSPVLIVVFSNHLTLMGEQRELRESISYPCAVEYLKRVGE